MEAHSDRLTVPDYTTPDTAGSDGDVLSTPTSGHTGAIRLDESADPQPDTGIDVASLQEAARLAVAAHREVADEHLQAETDWRAALSGPDWEQHQEQLHSGSSQGHGHPPHRSVHSGKAGGSGPGRV